MLYIEAHDQFRCDEQGEQYVGCGQVEDKKIYGNPIVFTKTRRQTNHSDFQRCTAYKIYRLDGSDSTDERLEHCGLEIDLMNNSIRARMEMPIGFRGSGNI